MKAKTGVGAEEKEKGENYEKKHTLADDLCDDHARIAVADGHVCKGRRRNGSVLYSVFCVKSCLRNLYQRICRQRYKDVLVDADRYGIVLFGRRMAVL